jgi:uncharacterized membrane protein
MAAELARWQHDGLIDTPTAQRLAPRYDRDGQMLAAALKWLGLFAIFQLGLTVLSFISLMSQSEAVGALLLALASAATAWWGIRLATDPLDRYPTTGSALLTVALAGAFGAAVLALLALDSELGSGSLAVVMALTAALGTLLAYRFGLRWPLLLALLLAFHAAGTWHAYVGHGGYFFNIQEPMWMAPLALAVAVLGFWHERVLEARRLARCTGFGHLYLILGLLYLNLSLWLLSLGLGVPRGETVAAVVVFSVACVAQIVAGARCHDGRITGFGIVFLSINLYTRFFEHFWDRMALGTSLLLAGAAAMVLGALIERGRKRS